MVESSVSTQVALLSGRHSRSHRTYRYCHWWYVQHSMFFFTLTWYRNIANTLGGLGNTGIGKETVRALLAHNATVYLAARSESKANEAIRELMVQTGGREAIFLELDLANLESVQRAVKVFAAREKELHMLFCNGYVF